MKQSYIVYFSGGYKCTFTSRQFPVIHNYTFKVNKPIIEVLIIFVHLLSLKISFIVHFPEKKQNSVHNK